MSEHCLVFSGSINQNTCGIFIPYLIDLRNCGAKKLTIAINSPGGNVVEGIAMHNSMIAMPFEIVTHNFGNVDSIANVIFLGGTDRRANVSATFMFHGVGFNGNANERLEEKNLLEKLDTIQSDHRRISSVIAGRSGLSEIDCMKLFSEQKTRDANWARVRTH